MFIFTLILAYLLADVSGDEVYENSTKICSRCSCTTANDFVLDCSNKSFHNIPANWPEHNTTLVATFSFNNITTLKILPITKQKAKLIFDHCNIKYVDEGAFANVPNVEHIDLSYNLLTTEEIDGQNFKGPYNNSVFYPISVRYLNLAYNQIHSIPRKFFENMPHLEELNLAGNDFTVLDVNTQTAISTLSNLKVLNLADNELTELIDGVIEKLHKLVELDLSNNLLDFVPNTLDFIGKNLKVLNLSNNLIFRLDDKSFLGLDLQEIYLDNLSQLDYVRPNTFTPLRNLKKISMSNNLILKAIDVEAFDKKQQLSELRLSNNSLTEIRFQMLDWSSLKMLDLKDNSLECTCDLYNISKALNPIVTKNMDGPVCIDFSNGQSTLIYQLTEEVCNHKNTPNHISHAVRRFGYIRLVIIWLASVLFFGGFLAVLILYLKYRRLNAFRNYNFASAQVSYFPISA